MTTLDTYHGTAREVVGTTGEPERLGSTAGEGRVVAHDPAPLERRGQGGEQREGLVDPAEPTTFYAYVGMLYVSHDSGASWSEVSMPVSYLSAAAIAPTSPMRTASARCSSARGCVSFSTCSRQRAAVGGCLRARTSWTMANGLNFQALRS